MDLLSRDETVFFYRQSKEVFLPVVTLACTLCNKSVDVMAPGSFYVSRVNGDSRYGYEPTHESCADEWKAAYALEELDALNCEGDFVADATVLAAPRSQEDLAAESKAIFAMLEGSMDHGYLGRRWRTV